MLSVDNMPPGFGDMDSTVTAAMEFPKLPCLAENEEWTYTMRRTMQEIVPGLFLGPYSAAMKSKKEILLNHGITHIVCVRQSIEAHFIRPNFKDTFRYLELDIADTVTENIIQHFPKVRAFINESLENGGKTLVHGNAGISRSAALVLAYIMEKYGLSCSYAFSLVQQRRFCINPNEGFMQQLAEFEPIYKAQRTLQNGQCSTEKNRNKRRIDQVDDNGYTTEAMDVSLS
ncbi:serine/threonine/tyrosine-interacting protein [Anabrus simplex]|uniref:serine/threonine/tyrosine-interacting protein n=1 Tax=Anabrus simplex TaxID=316456 RepID=UPI0034DD4433